MSSRRDIGPIGTALFGVLAGFIFAAFLHRVVKGGSPFARKPDGGALAASATGPRTEPEAGTPPVAATATVSLAPPAVKAAVPDAGAAPLPNKHVYNVLLITIDTLRYDLGFMGYPKAITPNIDALAARGAVFERTYSTASFTPKSLGPLHIGRYASETYRDFEHYTTFFPANVFMAERAHDAGARTFAGTCHRYFTFKSGFQQGFDVFDTSAMPPGMTDSDRRSTSKQLTDVAIDMLSKPANVASGRPFFAWFHYFDPHLPYVPHEGAPDFGRADRTQSGHARAQYDEEVWFTDRHVGRLLDFVTAQPWGASTAIILTADHGEAFGEHKLWGHGRELWEPLVRVPLIVVVPGAAPKRVTVRRSHIDLAPTVLELLGAPAPAAGSLRGTSLVGDAVARPEQALAEHDVFIDMPEGPFNEMRRAYITGPTPGTKLIDVAGRRFEVYDLARDPEESQNLGSDRERLQLLVDKLRKLRSGLDVRGP
jgi:arylsulfatase A-like enzyme